LVYR